MHTLEQPETREHAVVSISTRRALGFRFITITHRPSVLGPHRFMMPETYGFAKEYNPYFLQASASIPHD